jgi:hypothetical protein
LSAEPVTIGVSSPGNSYWFSRSNLHLDQLQQLGVVHHVGLVQVHHDVGHAHLARQQDVLARLRHRAVGRRDHQDRTVHLRRSGDHVLHVVGVTGAVHVRVVAVVGLVLDVRGRDRDTPRALLRGVVDLVVRLRLTTKLLRLNHRQRRRQRRLTMVHVTDRAYIYMRLRAFELLL